MSKKRDSFRQAFAHGWEDRAVYGLLRAEQLYRRGWVQRLAWRLGWEAANATTKTPLRTAKKARGER